MVSEDQRRKKRRRGRRRGSRRGAGTAEGAGRTDEAQAQAQASTTTPLFEWQWRTFPVFFAFVCGGLLILLIGPKPNTDLYSVLFFVYLGAVAFGLAHMATRLFIARRRR